MNTKKITDYISSTLLNGKAISHDQDLLLSGLIDSLAVIKLILFLETEFDVTIPPEDVTVENMASVDAMATYLNSLNQQ